MSITRRDMLAGSAAMLATGCGEPDPEACLDEGGPAWTEDGPWPETCQVTASDIEGPFYREDAPERADLTTFGDEGTVLELAGRVLDRTCASGLGGAVVELWHADPDGNYDNRSSEMRYRTSLTCDSDGAFALRTLLPGRYPNGGTLRPRHIHVKVLVDGTERLTTQLYFEGDPFNECDPFVNTSLILPFTGSEATEMQADVDLVLA